MYFMQRELNTTPHGVFYWHIPLSQSTTKRKEHMPKVEMLGG